MRVDPHRSPSSRARQRALRAAKQKRYRTHFKLGFRSFRVAADRTVVADFLREAGVVVPDQEPATLAICLGIFFQDWEQGRVRVTRLPDGLG